MQTILNQHKIWYRDAFFIIKRIIDYPSVEISKEGSDHKVPVAEIPAFLNDVRYSFGLGFRCLKANQDNIADACDTILFELKRINMN